MVLSFIHHLALSEEGTVYLLGPGPCCKPTPEKEASEGQGAFRRSWPLLRDIYRRVVSVHSWGCGGRWRRGRVALGCSKWLKNEKEWLRFHKRILQEMKQDIEKKELGRIEYKVVWKYARLIYEVIYCMKQQMGMFTGVGGFQLNISHHCILAPNFLSYTHNVAIAGLSKHQF